ncbi:MAG: ATP-binding cassette domain-containing protein [Betaproteobacteria bacterium]
MIVIQNISLRRGTKLVLENASVTLQPGEKVGLVGRNGAGKSSLFALLNGTLQEDKGEWSVPQQWQMGQVSQHMPETSDSATEFVCAGDTRLMQAQAQLDAAQMSDDGMAIAHAYAELADAGEHDSVSRAQSLIMGLGFKTTELMQPVNSFSGGWRMRLQLARALMCPSDLLLLDEPTNHLDMDALVWLEAWLKRYSGTLIVISHDREFLDAVTQVTLHIDNAQITRYGGNYSQFELLRGQQMTLQQAAFSKQQEKIAHLQKFIDRFKAKASKAKQAQSRVKALERMERVAPMLASADFDFEFKEPGNLPNPMLAISDADMGYQSEEGPRVVLKGVKKSVLAGQRIGILGANGQGKSTLVKTLTQALDLLDGTMTQGKGLTIGYFAQQELDVLKEKDTPLEHMIALSKIVSPQAREQDLRDFLGSFRFGNDMVKQSVGTLSGGEKARLVLAMVVWQKPNLLILDEPTNHLDLMTREALGMAINGFEGSVLLVSHDRSLLRSVCEEFWLVYDGEVKSFDGDLDDYQKHLEDVSRQLASTSSSKKATSDKSPSFKQKKQSPNQNVSKEKLKPLKKKLSQLEEKITSLEKDKLNLQDQLNQEKNPAAMADFGKKLKTLETDLAYVEAEWLIVSEEIEAIEKETKLEKT